MSFVLPSAEVLAAPVQPDAAILYWASKSALPYREARKLAAGARQRAFYVGGLARRAAVQTVYDGLDEALKNGTTLEEFKKRIASVIAQQGWNDFRVENIFRTNMQTAYSVGRYVKMQEVKELRPYWQYYGIMDGKIRITHAALSGLVYPADHEFWDSNYPPNGFLCRCGVRTLSRRQVEKQKIEIKKDMPKPGPWMDPRSGRVFQVLAPGADKGFRNNPGKDWMAGLSEAINKQKDLPNPLTPESYAEQRLRPKPVKNLVELGAGIQEKCASFAKNSNGLEPVTFSAASYFLATNSRGKLWVSTRSFDTAKGTFHPSRHLKAAWNKLAKGEGLDWHEEYAVEGLWHELIHNRQVFRLMTRGSVSQRIMESVTQWTARRSYTDLLEALGGKAAHQASIINEGLGYGTWIRNLNALIGAIGADEKKVLKGMFAIIDTVPRDAYLRPLVALLAKESGADAKMLELAVLKTDEPSAVYEELLGVLKLVK